MEEEKKEKGCSECWHNYHCPMPQEGYDFNPDDCQYNPDRVSGVYTGTETEEHDVQEEVMHVKD